MPRFFGLVVFGFITVLFAGCLVSDNDGKKEPPSPGIPAITWISISEGQTVRTRNMPVSWKGNEFSRRYRYTLDGVSSAWFDSTSCTLSDLASGGHTLAVQAANDSLTGDPLTVRFTVEAATGPGIRLSPSVVSGAAYVSLFLEEMSGIMAAHIEIAGGDSCARMKEFVSGKAASAGGVLVFADTRDPYRLILDIGFPEQGKGFSGSLELGSFVVSPVKAEGTVAVDPQKTVFRDTRNQPATVERFEPLRIVR